MTTKSVRKGISGDEGDGIAEVECGYVVTVPEGQQPTVETDPARQTVSFATVVYPGPSRPGR